MKKTWLEEFAEHHAKETGRPKEEAANAEVIVPLVKYLKMVAVVEAAKFTADHDLLHLEGLDRLREAIGALETE